MKFIGTYLVPMSRIKGPGNLHQLEKEARVVSLAESIRVVGLLNPLKVDRERNLRKGRDRFAALSLLGVTQARCDVYDGTEEEWWKLGLHERAYRRHSPAEQKLALEDLMNESRRDLESSMGRKVTPGEVRREAARRKGVHPDSIVRQERRLSARMMGPKWMRELDRQGVELDEEWTAHLTEVGHQISQITNVAQRAITQTRLLNETTKVHKARELEQDLRAVTNKLRNMMPASVCPKCHLEHKDTCALCEGRGWLTVSEYSDWKLLNKDYGLKIEAEQTDENPWP